MNYSCVSRVFIAALIIHSLFLSLVFADDAQPANLEERYEWIEVNPHAPFMPRDGAGALTYQDRMWLIGGWNPGKLKLKCSNDVWNSADGKTWTMIKPNTFLDAKFDGAQDWEGRHTAGYAVHDQ